MANLTASEVARWLLIKNNENERQFDGDSLTHLKIQKLLYYAQGVHLAYTGNPLFDEDMFAWEHGPVVPCVYNEYKPYGSDCIKYERDESDVKLCKKISKNDDTINVLESVFEHYGKYSAWHLRNMTHEEKPWKSTKINKKISKEKIKKYFYEEVLKH